jgi:hypothetical protein
MAAVATMVTVTDPKLCSRMKSQEAASDSDSSCDHGNGLETLMQPRPANTYEKKLDLIANSIVCIESITTIVFNKYFSVPHARSSVGLERSQYLSIHNARSSVGLERSPYHQKLCWLGA